VAAQAANHHKGEDMGQQIWGVLLRQRQMPWMVGICVVSIKGRSIQIVFFWILRWTPSNNWQLPQKNSHLMYKTELDKKGFDCIHASHRLNLLKVLISISPKAVFFPCSL